MSNQPVDREKKIATLNGRSRHLKLTLTDGLLAIINKQKSPKTHSHETQPVAVGNGAEMKGVGPATR
jgi:hypothetical protein